MKELEFGMKKFWSIPGREIHCGLGTRKSLNFGEAEGDQWLVCSELERVKKNEIRKVESQWWQAHIVGPCHPCGKPGLPYWL